MITLCCSCLCMRTVQAMVVDTEDCRLVDNFNNPHIWRMHKSQAHVHVARVRTPKFPWHACTCSTLSDWVKSSKMAESNGCNVSVTMNKGSASSNRQVRTGRQLVTITPLPPGYHPPHVAFVQPDSQLRGASTALNFRPTSNPVVSNSKSQCSHTTTRTGCWQLAQ